MFVYQPTFSMLEYKELGTEYITSWKPKGSYNSKLIAFDKYYPPNIKYFNKKIETHFDNGPLVAENNYFTKIANVCIINDIHGWPKSISDNAAFKNSLFGATSVVKNNDKEKYAENMLKKMLKNLSRYLDSYENITLLGDFNMTPEDKNLEHFTDTFSLEHLINEPTCFKLHRSHYHQQKIIL